MWADGLHNQRNMLDTLEVFLTYYQYEGYFDEYI